MCYRDVYQGHGAHRHTLCQPSICLFMRHTVSLFASNARRRREPEPPPSFQITSQMGYWLDSISTAESLFRSFICRVQQSRRE